MAYLQHAHHRAFRYPGLNVRANERNEARFNFRVQPNLDKINPRALVMLCLQDIGCKKADPHDKLNLNFY